MRRREGDDAVALVEGLDGDAAGVGVDALSPAALGQVDAALSGGGVGGGVGGGGDAGGRRRRRRRSGRPGVGAC